VRGDSPSLSASESPRREGTLEYFLEQDEPAEVLRSWLGLLAGENEQFSSIEFEGLRGLIARSVVEIDELVKLQLTAILHHDRFQLLEANWRSLGYLVDAAMPYRRVKVRLLDYSWSDVCRDIERANEFDQSHLFRRVYSEEFDMPGGEPFGMLIGFYRVSHRPSATHSTDDVATLRGVAEVAASAFAPFVCGASAGLFGLDRLGELSQTIRLEEVFRGREYGRWNSLRDMEESRFLAVTAPDVLLRPAWGLRDCVARGLNYEEVVQSSDGSELLWGSAALAFGCVVIREFGETGWFSSVRGIPRGYMAGGLAVGFPSLSTPGNPEAYTQGCTSVVIPDALEKTLSELGVMSLTHCYGTPFAAFHNNPSLQRPRVYEDNSATANARISAMLQQILCASRFAHYIKVIIRDKVGSFFSELECEQTISSFLMKYTNSGSNLSWARRAEYPLRAFKVTVKEKPDKPGAYFCSAYLRPHYVAEQIESELRLTTELVQAGRAA
jgi:type VI secretion system protein ImpD